MTDLTIGVSTCGRPRLLKRCLNSIKRFTSIPYKLIILDNVKAFTDRAPTLTLPSNATLIEIKDKKIGCCESNNIIADACDTQYLMHIDDDVYLEDNSIIDNMLTKFKRLREYDSNIGVLGGSWYDTYYKGFRHCSMKYIFGESIDGIYFVKKLPIPFQFANKMGMDYIATDECLHSMILDIEHFRANDIRWDNNFKWKGDRLDYFMQLFGRWKCLQYTKQHFIHDPQPFKYGSISYEDFNGKGAIKYFKDKWNLTPIVGWDKYQDKPK